MKIEKIVDKMEIEKIVDAMKNEKIVDKMINEKIVDKMINEKSVDKIKNEKIVENIKHEKIVEKMKKEKIVDKMKNGKIFKRDRINRINRKNKIGSLCRIVRISIKVLILGLINLFGLFIDKKQGKKKIIDNKFHIPIAYATDNGYIYPTLVAMTSLTENARNNTYYDIYVMISHDLLDENKIVLKSVEKNHSEHCSVYFIDMEDKFKDEETNERITTPTYYRLELHNLLLDVQRIIWMDGDTVVFEDLTELITLDMHGNYIMGFLDDQPWAMEKFGFMNATVLCAGVLLMDLEALRVNNMTEKFKNFMIKERGRLDQHDQTIIIAVCQGKIGVLPPKYGIWYYWNNFNDIKGYNLMQKPWLRYNVDELKRAFYHPAILHYVGPKPFYEIVESLYHYEWWNFANISGYYNEIYNKSFGE